MGSVARFYVRYTFITQLTLYNVYASVLKSFKLRARGELSCQEIDYMPSTASFLVNVAKTDVKLLLYATITLLLMICASLHPTRSNFFQTNRTVT